MTNGSAMCNIITFAQLVLAMLVSPFGELFAAEKPAFQTRPYYVVLEGEPAADVAIRLREQGLVEEEVVRATRARIAEIERQQAVLVSRLQAIGVEVGARFSRLANAVKARVTEHEVEVMLQVKGVAEVKPVVSFCRLTSTSVPFIGAHKAWNHGNLSATGKGVSIGIIDSGIDYTHAMFGGSGKPSDYQGNDPARIEPGTFPTKKVAGGYDFAGEDYDGDNKPRPDPDPLDCAESSHGSHVAGIAAGFGVTKEGNTHTGGYDKSIDFEEFLIGPGVSPEATLFALKVFGCEGATRLVMDAMEWAADPDKNGDFDDRLDIVNLSLGSAYSHPDVENDSAQRLSLLGCLVVKAAGNSGNNFYNLATMGDHPLSVASSIDDGIENNTIEIVLPPSIAGHYEAVEAAFTKPLSDAGKISGKVVYSDPPQACEDLVNAGALEGNIALIDRGVCFFYHKIRRARDAGAIAVIVVNNEGGPPIAMGWTGDTVEIPAVMINKRDGEKLKKYLSNDLWAILGSKVTIGGPELADQLAPSSSRGPVYETHLLKPDIVDPGFNIHSVKAGSGNKELLVGGTSMAAPHSSGAAALLKERHPDWSALTIKAAMMNTSLMIPDENGKTYPESRIGAGRLQIEPAILTPVTATDADHPERVSLSYGLLEIAEPYEADRWIEVKNFENQPWTGHIAVSNTLANAGVSLTSAEEKINVPIKGSNRVKMVLKIEPSQIQLYLDPTTSPEVKGGPRHVVHEASGQIWFHGEHHSVHVPYHMLIKPVGNQKISVTKIAVAEGAATSEIIIPINGNIPHFAPLVSVFQLGHLSPSRNYQDREWAARDLRAVGAASNAVAMDHFDEARVFFGVAMDGNWISPQSFLTSIGIEVDTNLDRQPDFELWNGSSGDALVQEDISIEELADDAFSTILDSGEWDEPRLGGILNLFSSAERETALFNNSVMILSAKTTDLGLTKEESKFHYRFSNLTETTRWILFDSVRPVLETVNPDMDSTPYHAADRPVSIRVNNEALEVNGLSVNDPSRALLLFHHNQSGKRFGVVPVSYGVPDTDGDGIPDSWEMALFGGLNTVGADTDFDEDHFFDVDEYQAGCDPRDAGSFLGFQTPIVMKNGTVGLSWKSVRGKSYRIEKCNDARLASWKAVAKNLKAEPPMNMFTDLHLDNGKPVFYRILLEIQ